MPQKDNVRRSDGLIAVQVYLGKVNGKRKYKTVYGKSQREADKKADEVKRALQKGLVPSKDNFETWAEHFLTIKQTEVSENQYKLIEARIKFWNQKIGAMDITKIRPVDIQPVFISLAKENPRTGKPTAKNTLLSYKQILAAVFNYAIDNRIIDYNPVLSIKLPQNAPENKRRALTQEEQRRIREFDHRCKPAVMLMMYSGLRRGEAAALRWSDIDFKNKTISVTKSYDYKTESFKSPKNGKPRLVSIPDILVDFLKTLPQSSEYVLTTKQGKRMTESAWKRMLESYLYDMNMKYGDVKPNFKKYSPEKIPLSIEPFTWHCLRHTFCTLMYSAGVDVLTAKEQMGHSDVKTTLAIYTHLENEHKQQNISKLNDFLSGSASDYASKNA